jgi:peptidoglycan/xylan/chitin deacetylase (PgdA/CDA1 family)
MKVALTFDVESDFSLGRTFKNIRESLPSIVKVLNEEGIKSTFFVSGRVLEEFNDYVLDLLKGHEVASHGYNHTRLDKLNKLEIENEIRKSKIVFSEYGLEPMGFRAPKLCVNEKVLDVVSNYYRYDSSILPFVVPFRYFNLLKRRTPHAMKNGFVEIPIGTVNFLKIPATSSWMFLFGKKYLNFLTFGYPKIFVLLFHSFDFMGFEAPKILPSYKRKLYYSKCGDDKIDFLKELIEFFKSKKEEFLSCREIYNFFIASQP